MYLRSCKLNRKFVYKNGTQTFSKDEVPHDYRLLPQTQKETKTRLSKDLPQTIIALYE